MEKNEQALLISSLKSELKTTKEYTDKQIKDLQDRLERLTNKDDQNYVYTNFLERWRIHRNINVRQ